MFKCLKQSLHSNYQGTHTHTQTDTAFYSLGLRSLIFRLDSRALSTVERIILMELN